MTVTVIDPMVTTLGETTARYDEPSWNMWNSALTLLDMEIEDDSEPAEDLIEAAGRACYQSFHKPNPATRKNSDYIAHIISQGHGSVLEHASASFYLEGVSRALTHELIRHRHLSYSQLSQRFVNEGRRAIVVPPAIRDIPAEVERLRESADRAFDEYERTVTTLLDRGEPRKQAREAARAHLPNCTETKIVVTGNMRAWRDVLGRRLDPAADAEIREVSQMILDELRSIVPSCFQDFE